MFMSRRTGATAKSSYGKDGSAFFAGTCTPLQPKPHPFAAWVTDAPARAFAAFLALHAAVWTLLPTLLYANLPLDLIEALMYGREWQLGYDKPPPLPWWLVEAAYRLTGHDFAYYLLAQIAVVAAFALIYAAALVAPMVVFALVDRDARKALATPGPYVAAAVALIVAAPHLVWLVQNDFLPFAYAEHRAVLPRGWYDHLWHPFEFAVSQLFF